MYRLSMLILSVLLLTGSVPAIAEQPSPARHRIRLVSFEGAPIRVVSEHIDRSDTWLKNLAFEVENVSDKPIYYFSLQASLDGTEKTFGAPVVITLTWGSPRLASPYEKASASDIVLRPGERVSVTAPESNVGAFYELLHEKGGRMPTSAEVVPYVVGTGARAIWIVGRIMTQEQNELLLASAKRAQTGNTTLSGECGFAATDGSYYDCLCAATHLRIFGLAPDPAGTEKVVNKTCTWYDEYGIAHGCAYKVVRPCP